MCSMTAPHAQGKKLVDPVFSVAAAAKAAKRVYGDHKVVDASIGTIYDDRGEFAALNTVAEVMAELSPSQMMNYAPINGVPGFAEAAIKFAFGQSQPEAYLAAAATPGGTGAIRNVFFNYAGRGDDILVPDWYWGPYRTIAGEPGLNVDTYRLFTEENTFNAEALKEKVLEKLKRQDNLVIVFNSPAHNPTGFTLTLADWNVTIDFLKEAARDKAKKLTVLLDVAYMDYAGDGEQVREFFKLFSGLPANILVAVAFSMSKSFLVYGMRCGALIAISSAKEVVEEFSNAVSYSNRANWSNVSRLPQELLVRITNDTQLVKHAAGERAEYQRLIEARAKIFVKEAEQVGLEICPYTAGFFISVPSADPAAEALRLQQDHIFVVPLKKGLRYAVCSIPTDRIPGLAQFTKKAIEECAG